MVFHHCLALLYPVFALDLSSEHDEDILVHSGADSFFVPKDHIRKSGNVKEKRGMYLDKAARESLEDLKERQDMSGSALIRIAIKFLDFTDSRDPQFLEDVKEMEEKDKQERRGV